MTGDGATVWDGTALEECTSDRIVLRHSQFEPGYNINQTCGASGPIVGHAISKSDVNDSYTSQLTISVSQHLNGSTIECTSDSGRQVGSSQILITTGKIKVEEIVWISVIVTICLLIVPLPTPSNIKLAYNKGRLMLTWLPEPVFLSCPAVHYNINATNCGKCPDTTTSNNVTCIIDNTITLPQTCTLTLQSVVCGNVLGTYSEPVTVIMKGLSLLVLMHATY